VTVAKSVGMRGQQQKNACCHLAAGRRQPLLQATHKHLSKVTPLLLLLLVVALSVGMHGQQQGLF
jgi:hypothetical protein